MQPGVTSVHFEQLGKAYELEYMDFTGCTSIDDMFFMQMGKNRVPDTENPSAEATLPWPGL
jgi:hypothetical protein